MELKYLDKLKCYQILSDSGGPPLRGVADGWMGWGWVWVDGVWVCMGVWGDVPCTHTHMHVHTHMHIKHAKHGCLNVGGHLQFLYMYKCACVHVHVCICICVGGHPHAPRCPPPTCPLPRAAGSPKHQNSISPELIEIIRFCLKILYL